MSLHILFVLSMLMAILKGQPTPLPQPQLVCGFGVGDSVESTVGMQLAINEGLPAEVFANLPSHPSSIVFAPDGTLYAAVTYGEYPVKVADTMRGGIYQVVNGESRLLLEGLHHPVGLLFVGDDLYVSHLGEVLRIKNVNGTSCSGVDAVVSNLPFDEAHQTNGMVFRDGRIFISQGNALYASSQSRLELRGTIFSVLLDGSDLRVEVTGLRNTFDLVFDDLGRLWGADNGPNVIYDPGITEEDVTPDELNLLVPGKDYDSGGEKPAALFEKHVAASGITWDGERVLIALWAWGQVRYYNSATGTADDFLWNLSAPTDIIVGPDGWYYIAEWQGNRIIRVILPQGQEIVRGR